MVYYFVKEENHFRLTAEDVKNILSTETINRILKYKNPEHISDSFNALMLLCFVIKTFSASPNKQIKLKYNKFGKPYIENEEMFFSISHSETLITCAVSQCEIGVDVQDITPYLEDYTIVLSEREIEYIRNSEDRNIDFTILWTLKEAYGKYLGVGLLYDVNNVEFICKGTFVKQMQDKKLSTLLLKNAVISVCSDFNEKFVRVNPDTIVRYVLGGR